MPKLKLTELEKEQNKQFLFSLLQNFDFPPTLSFDETCKIIQEVCDEYGIWLKGINRLIVKEITEQLNQAINKGSADDVRTVCAALQKALAEENLILRRQFASSANANGLRAAEATISMNIQAKKIIANSYWLQEEDISLALEALKKINGVSINQPVSFIDSLLKKQIENQIKDQNVKIAFVPVCSNQHWTLTIFKANTVNNTIESYSYNPPGDGKCGDHVIRKAYREVEETLNVNTAYGSHLNESDANSARQTTIDLIKAVTVEARPVNRVEEILSENSEVKPVNTSAPQRPLASQFGTVTPTITEINNRYSVWNQKANVLLDKIANDSDQQKAVEWKKFIDAFEKAAENLVGNKTVSCAAEADSTQITRDINLPISAI